MVKSYFSSRQLVLGKIYLYLFLSNIGFFKNNRCTTKMIVFVRHDEYNKIDFVLTENQ